MKRKIIITTFIFLGILGLILFLFRFFIHFDMQGNKTVYLGLNQLYQEEGIKAHFFGKELNITIEDTVDSSSPGKYTIKYKAKTKLGISRSIKRTIIVGDKNAPIITLKGKNPTILALNEAYIEEGASAVDSKGNDISTLIKTNGKIDVTKPGTYKIEYIVTDKNGHQNQISRKVVVSNQEKEISYSYKAEYDKIDNKKRGWWSGNKKDHTRPSGGANEEELKKYNAFFMGPDTKTIYLTFDEGDNETYLPQIADILNKYKIKATFFLCQYYILSNPEVINKLVEHGHSIGNHTHHHYDMTSLANKEKFDQYLKEIKDTEEAFAKVTGKQIDKVYREPRGDWSYRSLQIVKDLGYRSYFWSADYLDWGKENSKETALSNLMARYHNGAIYLIHPKSKGNYEAIEDFIKNMKDLGYEFGLVKDIK